MRRHTSFGLFMLLLTLLVLACSADSALATYTRTWQKIINTSILRQLAQLNNGDILVGGKTGTGASQNFQIYRLKSSDGSTVWSKTLDSTFTNDDIFDLIADPATGDAWFAGQSSSASQGLNWYVQKISGADGSFVWGSPFIYNSSGTTADTARSIAFVNESVGGPNIVLCGDDNSTGGHIVKLNASTGAQMWAFDLPNLARAVRTDVAGNIYVAGYLTNGSASVVARYNAGGTQIWSKTFSLIGGGTLSNFGGLAIDPASGDAILTSQSSAAAGGNDIAVVRFKASDGSVVWQQAISGAAASSNDSSRGVVIDGSSAYVIGIVANGGSTGGDWLVASLNLANGNVNWQNSYTGEGSANTGDQPDNLQVVGTDLFVSGFLGFATTGAGRSSTVLRLDKATGTTVEQTIFKDRVGPTTQPNTRNMIVLSTGDVITAGDSGATSGAAEITRYGTSIPLGASAPTVTSVTATTADGAYKAGASVAVTVTFSASVTVTGAPTLALNSGGTATYASGSPGTTLTFNYTVGATQNSADLDYTATTSLALSGGTINATSGGTAATLTLPSPGAVGSLGANKAIVIDTTLPTVSIGAPSVTTITAGAGSVTYAVTYADTNFASSSLTTGGITLNKTGTANGTVGLTGSGTSYTVTISSITGVGTLGITVGANTSLDSAGNANLASSASTTFAVTAPSSFSGTMMFTNNTGLADGIAQDGEAGSSDIPGITIQVINITDTAGTNLGAIAWKDNTWLASNNAAYSGLTYDQNAGCKGMAIKSSDGSEFQLSQFLYYNWGETSSTTITVKGYRNAVEVASTTFQAYNAGYLPFTVNLDSTFNNVDDVRLYISGGGYLGNQTATNHSINNIVIASPVVGPTAPTVSNITSTKADGSYNATTLIPISITFSASVDVTGNPTLALNSGGTATYASGSPGTTLTFNYTVGAAQNSADLDYSGTTSLALAGGTINATSGGTAATLTLPTPGIAGSLGNNKALVIDTVRPTVSSITRFGGAAQTTGGTSVKFHVVFSEAVQTVTSANFSIQNINGGTVTGTIGTVTGSGSTWDVPVTITGGAGEFKLTVN